MSTLFLAVRISFEFNIKHIELILGRVEETKSGFNMIEVVDMSGIKYLFLNSRERKNNI